MSQRYSATLQVRGIDYKIGILDDGLDTDPTLLVFRGDEETAVATIHLDPEAKCLAWPGSISHVVVRAGEEDD